MYVKDDTSVENIIRWTSCPVHGVERRRPCHKFSQYASRDLVLNVCPARARVYWSMFGTGEPGNSSFKPVIKAFDRIAVSTAILAESMRRVSLSIGREH